MPPTHIGPYTLDGVLGEGAMGVVHRARGADGVAVALKTVHVDSADQLDALRREISALARLRHPGIARVLDHGLHEGLPWYAMELVDGVPMSVALNRVSGGNLSADMPSSADTWSGEFWDRTPIMAERAGEASGFSQAAGGQLEWALSLCHSLCESLAWLHGEGLVHRDLKPANVLVVDRSRPVLVDFGLARRFSAGGREKLVVDRHRAGTVSYMAPEQIRGEPVDARADLYALGCVLYELITGRPPFVSESAAAVMDRHLNVAPAPLSERVDGVS